jgi:hypothetical protein
MAAEARTQVVRVGSTARPVTADWGALAVAPVVAEAAALEEGGAQVASPTVQAERAGCRRSAELAAMVNP